MSSDPHVVWCSDALHDLLGFTDSALALYLVTVARRASSSPDNVLAELVKGGIEASPKAQSFCRSLCEKCAGEYKGKRAVTPSSKKSNAEWIKEAAAYELLEDENGEETELIKAEAKTRKRQRRRIKEPTKQDLSEDENITTVRRPDEDRRRRRLEKINNERKDSSSFSKENSDLDRENDIKERDEFVRRMLTKDKFKTKQKIHEDEEKYQEYEQRVDMEQRLARGETILTKEGTALTLDKLREQSRSLYLKKREERELLLLKQELEDEQELFGDGVKLTKLEKQKEKLAREILRMNKGSEDTNENTGDFYRLPDEYDAKTTKAEQDQKLMTRYVEAKGEKTEQELWEESQTLKATSLSRRKRPKVEDSNGKNYDYVFEEKIDFVMQGEQKGYDHREKHKQRGTLKENQDENELAPVTEHEKILQGRKKLPVFSYREEFLAAVKDHQVLVLVGETGSGKTTQIPQYLHEVGYSELGKIGCTQPRRVAAMSVAARVATEMNVRLGHDVGYSIRFENCTSQKTIIQYMTDGMLLREILTEPDLAGYSCLVIDEAHERTLHTDILFGLVKDVVRFRSDLRLIISSATLDAEKFSHYFDDASIFMIPGRMFPVDIYYTKSPEADYVDASVVTVLQIHVSQPLDGDILVFLTGQEEIETASEILTQRTRNLGSRIKELIICPIYANLPSEKQAKIFDKTPKGARKVVLATNIAETSLTINGICYVIDTGFAKQNNFNAKSGMESLVVTPISQAAANQRAGRAGRTQAGKCFRLYTAWSFQNELEPNTTPEILRTNMGNVVLMLKSLGINDLINFDFMDRPPSEALIRALEQLYALGALNDLGELTKLGRQMAEFPLEPMLSKSVIASGQYKCTSEVLSAVSMLSLGASVFYRPKEKAVHADTARLNFARGGGGDHIALMRCYDKWASTDFNSQWCFENFVQVKSMKKARDIQEQLQSLCERVGIHHNTSITDDFEPVLKSITSGFFYNIAKLCQTGEYQTVKQPKTVYIHPSSVLLDEDKPPSWVVFFELAFTSKEFMRQVAPIEPGWLIEIAPHFYQESDVEDKKKKKTS
mmetsp:Transcript_4561/g.7071  ORF Transcript_4561/g.7071 Transcript_4561/m.7071 type:complete len:1066 (+) Transcript_4561:101-3298(+)